ncbi:MAG: RNase adapter RapZ [Acidimicrobiia bacterium]
MTNAPHLIVITGMSGAGKSRAAIDLEDLGFEVVDNLPPALIKDVVNHVDLEDRPSARLAVIVDTRRGLEFDELELAIARIAGSGVKTSVLFLDASNEALLNRYSENRRPHPVAADSIPESIAKEREALADVRARADVVIDTTDRSVHQLRELIREAFSAEVPAQPMRVSVRSFGFKYGAPREVDLLLDVRFLPNPHWDPELRPLTGTDPIVSDYVLDSEDAASFLEKVTDLVTFLIPRFQVEGKSYVTIGIGCTGGRHRSVAIADELGKRLAKGEVDVAVRHRDIEK